MIKWLNAHGVVDWLDTHGIRILVITIIAVALYLLLRRFVSPLVKRTITQRMKRYPEEEIKKRVDTLSSAIVNTGTVVIAVFAIITILPEFGVNIAALLAALGIVGIAVGFGAQSLIRDLLAGIFILLEDQYRVGDVVKIAGIAGLVEQIGLRRTILRDLDGIVHSIPNGEIRVASNFTKLYSRVNLNISVAYGEDLDRVIKVINRVCKEMAEEPKWSAEFVSTPKVLRVDKLGDSGIDIKILGDTKPMRQWDIMGELRLRIKRTFDKEGIEIPWPHTKVYFGNTPPIIGEAQPMPEEPTNTKAEPS
ncbi:MAG: mechanosensitive ion channel family protein [Dehalococcoidia bacterium]|nr:mechanosensitive ion channel family protein [Dehalococcoidia bacterium]